MAKQEVLLLLNCERALIQIPKIDAEGCFEFETFLKMMFFFCFLWQQSPISFKKKFSS